MITTESFAIRFGNSFVLGKNPYSVNILLAGYDKETGPSLYYIDYIATLHKLEKGAFGYGSYFSLSMMDRHYHSGMSVKQAIDLVDKCIMEIRSRGRCKLNGLANHSLILFSLGHCPLHATKKDSWLMETWSTLHLPLEANKPMPRVRGRYEESMHEDMTSGISSPIHIWLYNFH
ncbi:Proteasome subunit beta type-2-A [Trifolium repens]|nr:Proteasome subunit beta type-2-A [Trifolium repens]WJX55032.1 Proteasome subunit beta type-2-A [Trifolium repens]